ncbi:MAG: hypothetical protein N2Z71_09885 [Caloramator sp.]|nr:hypothetical protein [Caloramator sp.]
MKLRNDEINYRDIDRSLMRYMKIDCRYCGYRNRASSGETQCKKCMINNTK